MLVKFDFRNLSAMSQLRNASTRKHAPTSARIVQMNGACVCRVLPAMTGVLWLLGAGILASAAPLGLEVVEPNAAQMNAEQLREIDALVTRGIAQGQMPGCVVVVGRRGKIVWRKAYGDRQIEPQRQAMTVDTLFDLASLTKPIATATSVMLLVERGQLAIDAPASKYIPEFTGHDKEKITLKQLLVHTSGLTPDNALSDYNDGPEKAWERICNLKLLSPPGDRMRYSDVGFIVLGKIVERVGGQSLDTFAGENLYQPLGMSETMYRLSDELKERAAPTEKRGGQWIRGEVHDPRAWKLGGVAGHAGLFSTADDLARFAHMLASRGTYGDVRILSPETFELMIAPHKVSGGVRGLGWDKRSGFSSNRGDGFSDEAIGHGGFTGTTFWVDPRHQLFVIFLSNRLHPDGEGAVNQLAGRIGTIAAQAIERE
jgi:CubicO group peptidase (beta-lactamase class C family)